MGKDVLAICGCSFTAASTLFTIISFSTPHWLESYEEAKSSFDRLGLWEACFNNFTYDKDNLGMMYDGCSWIFSYELRPIFDWLNPGWMQALQMMMTIIMIVSIVTTVLCLLGLLGCCPPKRAAIAMLTNSSLMFGCGTLLAVSVILFWVKADTDRQWLPRPDQNQLSWSFGMAIVAGFFAIFAGMCLLVEFLRLVFRQRKNKTPPPFGGYVMKRVPPEY